MTHRKISGILLTVLLCSSYAQAETRTYIREYKYQASESDSKLSARTVALEQVQQQLLSELGTLVKSRIDISQDSRGKNLSQHDITALTAGIVKTEILHESWNGYFYEIKARLRADPDEVARKLMLAYAEQTTPRNASPAMQRNLLIPQAGHVNIIARQDGGGKSDLSNEQLTSMMADLVENVTKKRLPEGTVINKIVDFDVTRGLLFEGNDGENNKKICGSTGADMNISAILEDHEGPGSFGRTRSMNLMIYDCKKAALQSHSFIPKDDSRATVFWRKKSTESELRKFIRDYLDIL